ncbi:MAG: PAS domain S-box protein [Deltaproteobacteria bacterium]|nr:PAS domain S-box protein [Deltaproteobacteria bacterium]
MAEQHNEREQTMARVFDMARIFFLLIVIPLSLLVLLIYTGIFEVGHTTKQHASAVIDEQFQNEIRMRAVNTAEDVAKFLEERRGDMRVATIIPRSNEAFRSFVTDKKGSLWVKRGDEFITVMVPLYAEMSLIDKEGHERIRIENGTIVSRQNLRDISRPENTTYRSERYFSETKELEAGEIYVSPVTGWYVDRRAFESGKTFTGILRFATPLYEGGEFAGMITLALDIRHLAEFTDHIIPTQAEQVAQVDTATGNYAYLVDKDGLIISHPNDYHIAGLDERGVPVAPLTEENAAEMSKKGYEVLNLHQLGFMDETLPEIAGDAARGLSGIKSYRFAGHTKFVAYAPIPFYSPTYPKPTGFGWVGMGIDVENLTTVMSSAFQNVEKEVETWTKTVIIILILSVILLLLISALLAKGISRQYQIIAKERAKHLEIMKKEFQERERTLLQIIQGSTIPTFVINRNHVVTHWNRALERLTGYHAEDIIGTKKHWQAFYSGEKPIMADLIVDNVNEEEIRKFYPEKGRKSPFIDGAYEAEGFFPHIGESGRWIYFTAAPIKGPDGHIVGAIETLWDRTDSKLLHAERERHLRQLSILWNITTAMSASMDPDARIRAFGKEIFQNFDIDSLAVYLMGKDGRLRSRYTFGYREKTFQDGGTEEFLRIVEDIARRQEIVFFENMTSASAPCPEFVDIEGLRSAAYVPLTSEAVTFGVALISSHRTTEFSEEDKNLLAIISNHVALELENARLHHEAKQFGKSLEIKVKEKTRELEESNAELRLSEEKYRNLFDADPNPIIIADRESLKILDVNATALECYKYTRSELLSRSFIDLEYQIDQQVLEGLERLVAPDQSLFYPKKMHKKKDGTSFYVDIYISSVNFMGKDCLIINTPDVTEHVERETQLIQASKMATLGTMASGIAHEISQPLNVMQVSSDFIIKSIRKGRKISDEDLAAMAEEIEKNVQRAAQTIRHMKDFVRKSQVATGDRVNINGPINDVFKILGQQLRVHGITVELELSEELPPIIADHNRLEQVFINLVTNARDALDEKEAQSTSKEIEKILRISSFVENGRVVVTVYDSGTGIPREIRDKIFEPFFTTKDVGKGTGLGISISYGIIKDYGGTIEVDSELGEGSTFTLTFPAAP